MKGQSTLFSFLKKPIKSNVVQEPVEHKPQKENEEQEKKDQPEQKISTTKRLRKKCDITKSDKEQQFIIPQKEEKQQSQDSDVTIDEKNRNKQQNPKKMLIEKQYQEGNNKGQNTKLKSTNNDQKRKVTKQSQISKKRQSKANQSSLLNQIEGNIDQYHQKTQKQKYLLSTNQKSQIQKDFELAQKLAEEDIMSYRQQKNNQVDDDIPKRMNKLTINSSSKQSGISEQQYSKKNRSKNNKSSRSKSKQSKKQEKVILRGKVKSSKVQSKLTLDEDNDDGSQPFEGKTIVLTGQFKHDRNLIETLLTKLGARITGSVSGKTSFLLQGYASPDGRPITATSSSRKAVELKTPIITHDALQGFFVQWTDKTLTQRLGIKEPPKQKSQTIQPLPSRQNKFVLWCTKYIPRNLDQVIGQSAPINKARKWLQGWQNVHVKGIKHNIQKTFQFIYPKGDLNSKAILFSGSPGIGKTTVARLLGAQYGYTVVQYNASDTRNKSSVGRIQSTSCGISFKLKKQKILLILDQVDGLSGGDRGGSAAMIQIIKKSAIPIICICNDRQSTKIKSLGGYCYDVIFDQPSKQEILKRLNAILQNQGIKYDKGQLIQMIETFNGDMRQILNFLNFECMGQSNCVSNNNNNNNMSVQNFKKDDGVLMNLWSASNRLLNRVEFQKLNMRERLNLFFVDSQFVPLIIQNCLRNSFQFPKIDKKLSDLKKKQIFQLQQKFSLACDYIEIGDILNRSIRKYQNWKLSPLFGLFSSVFPTEIISQSAKSVFPQWLGNYSKTKKISRQIRELQSSYRIVTSGSRKSTKDYTKVLYHLIHRNLEQYDKNKSNDQQSGLNKSVALMNTYRITPDMIKQHFVDLQLKQSDLMSNISTATKSALTRTYNQRYNSSKTTFAKSKANKGQQIIRYDPLLQQVIMEEQDNGEQESQIKQEVIVKKPKAKTKSKKTAKIQSQSENDD